MNTLVIYDNTGYIIFQGIGTSREPIGIPFMWVEVPEGKYVESIDVLVTPNIPVLVDLPKSEVQLLQEQVTDLNLAMADVLGKAGV